MDNATSVLGFNRLGRLNSTLVGEKGELTSLMYIQLVRSSIFGVNLDGVFDLTH